MIKQPPIFLFAFANDPEGSLRLGKESNAILDALLNAVDDRIIECQALGYTHWKVFTTDLIVIENGGMKRYRFLSDRLKCRDKRLYSKIVGIAAGLWNFNLTH